MSVEKRRLIECAGMECGAVDAKEPIVRRVKILGWDSKNGRQYLPESVTVEQYARLVNLNHTGKPGEQRRVEDRFGYFQPGEITVDDSGVWGDLHYNPKHPFAEQFVWFAENNPSAIGLSHDAVGTGKTVNGTFVVEKVVEVKSVDLVADPASTKGLKESMDPELTGDAGTEEKSLEQQIGELVVAIIKDDAPAEEKRSKVLKALKLLDEPETEETEESEEDPEAKGEEEEEGERKTEESLKTLAAKEPGVKALLESIGTMKTELAVLKAERADRQLHDLAHKVCVEAHLPKHAATPELLESLIASGSERVMKKIVSSVMGALNVQKPSSFRPTSGNSLDNNSFVAKLLS